MWHVAAEVMCLLAGGFKATTADAKTESHSPRRLVESLDNYQQQQKNAHCQDCRDQCLIMATDVAFDTSMGSFTVELYNEHAPKTCHNFSTLAQRGYYNDIIFHRIIPNFMVQTGDPTGTGRGGSSIYGEKFEDEIHAGLKHTGAGILSMANSGPNTNGSQFFVTLAPTPWLDGKHTIFGRVKSGMRVIQRMGLVKTGGDDKPVDEVKIIRARVVDERGEE